MRGLAQRPQRFLFAFAVAALAGGAVVCATAAFRPPRSRRVALARRASRVAPATAAGAIGAAVAADGKLYATQVFARY